MTTQTTIREFRQGDEVKLVRGSYQGTIGVFIRLKDDIHWADIKESNGRVRSHPLVWLAPTKQS